MHARSPCPQGHQWQPLTDAQSAGPPQYYCGVCGLVLPHGTLPETVLSAGAPTPPLAVPVQEPPPDFAPPVAPDQAETVARNTKPDGGTGASVETLPPATGAAVGTDLVGESSPPITAAPEFPA